MKSDFLKRFLTGSVGAGIIIPSLIYSMYGVWLLGVIVTLVSLWEYYRGMGIQEDRYKWPGLLWGAIFWGLVLAEDLVPGEQGRLIPFLLLTLPFFTINMLFDSGEKKPIERAGVLILGYVYIFLPFFLLYQMSHPKAAGEYDFTIPLGILWLTWTLDVMAYTFGKLFKGPALFLRISPRKTWMGALGGASFCLGMGVLMEYYLEGDHNWIIASGIISVFSQLGDLVESMFKRSVKLKDTSKLLPGHGGMLDRFDGMLMALPFLYLYFSQV